MLMGILFLGLVFIVSLITTFLINTPTKKLLAWFQSLSPKADPNSHVSTNPITTKASPKKMKSSSSSSQNKGELEGVFATFDKNNDGFITKGELRESLKNIGIFMGEKEVCDLVEKVDSNGDGLIDLDEFCEVFESMLSRDHEVIRGEDQEEDHEGGEEDLKEAFDVFDGDKDGLISVEELGLVLSSLGLKEGKRLESCKEMIKKVDMDGDGMVNFDEFKRMMKAGGRLVQVS